VNITFLLVLAQVSRSAKKCDVRERLHGDGDVELQATANVKDDPNAHRDVRVLPFFSNIQLPSQAPSSVRPLNAFDPR
jgi:hypothetical protein